MLFGFLRVRIQTTDAVLCTCKRMLSFIKSLEQGFRLRAGTHYPHVTWAHVMLRVQLGCERRFNVEFYDADSLLSLCLRHVISRGALVGSRACTPLTFLLSHTFREAWPTCRVHTYNMWHIQHVAHTTCGTYNVAHTWHIQHVVHTTCGTHNNP